MEEDQVAGIMGSTGAPLGTLYTHATGGFLLRIGKMNSYFQNLEVAFRLNRVNLQNFQFYGKAQLDKWLVGYIATLQAGFLNNPNPYAMPAHLIKRGVLQKSTGLVACYAGISLVNSAV